MVLVFREFVRLHFDDGGNDILLGLMCFSQAVPSIVNRVQKRRGTLWLLLMDSVLLTFCFMLQKLCMFL
jgi:hypothetical protein